MKLYYLNDTQTKQNLYVRDLSGFIKTLDKAEGTVVELPLPDGAIPFIKSWGGQVLISWWENYENRSEATSD